MMLTYEEKLEAVIGYLITHDEEFASFYESLEPAKEVLKKSDTRDVHVVIRDALIDAGVRPGLTGFKALMVALELIVKDYSYIKGVSKRLYPEVANILGTTVKSVDSAIRHVATYNDQTSLDFLATMAMRIEDKINGRIK